MAQSLSPELGFHSHTFLLPLAVRDDMEGDSVAAPTRWSGWMREWLSLVLLQRTKEIARCKAAAMVVVLFWFVGADGFRHSADL